MAARFGAPFAIVSGGLACILSVAIIARLVPAIRNYTLTTMPHDDDSLIKRPDNRVRQVSEGLAPIRTRR
ncbi:MAG: hypothetical protein V9E83_05415 [Baekduia sp.]